MPRPSRPILYGAGAVALGTAVVALLALYATSSWQVSGGWLDPGRLETLRGLVAAAGPFAPLLYILAVTVEVVVAPVPGLVLYAPGGVLFGGFLGGLYSWIGNILGASIAFTITRRLGRARLERRLADGEIARIEQRLARRGGWLVFLLRVNPLTSSDLVSYAAGLTSMPLRSLVVGTAAGMAPLCFIQSYAAASLLEAYPALLLPGAVLLLITVIVAVAIAVGAVRRERGLPAPR